MAIPDHPELKVLALTDMVLHSAVHLFYDGDFVRGLEGRLADLDALLRHFGADAEFWSALLSMPAPTMCCDRSCMPCITAAKYWEPQCRRSCLRKFGRRQIREQQSCAPWIGCWREVCALTIPVVHYPARVSRAEYCICGHIGCACRHCP